MDEFNINFDDGPYAAGADPLFDEFPDVLTYGDAVGDMWTLPDTAAMLGVDGEGNPVVLDFLATPHALISAGSGAGKSATSRAVVMQALVKGWTVVVLDAKRHSHRWAKNLPGVHYASTIRQIGTALISVGAEMHRRNEVVESWPGPIETAPVGPPILVLFEEMNATVGALADLDKTLEKGKITANEAFESIMFLGRAARVHVLAVAQYADRKAIKTSVRENMDCRILIQHSWEAWSMLVPRSSSRGGQPASPTQKGRGYVVTAGRPRETQLLFIEEELCAALVRQARPDNPRISRREDRRQRRAAIEATERHTGRAI